jgi:TMEM175 potassium channel family protein
LCRRLGEQQRQHHTIQLVKRGSGAVLWANLTLLFRLSLFPFTTAWMDELRFAPRAMVRVRRR